MESLKCHLSKYTELHFIADYQLAMSHKRPAQAQSPDLNS